MLELMPNISENLQYLPELVPRFVKLAIEYGRNGFSFRPYSMANFYAFGKHVGQSK